MDARLAYDFRSSLTRSALRRAVMGTAAAALAVSASGLGGCCRPGGGDASDRVAAEVSAPAGASWSHAALHVAYFPTRSGGHSTRFAREELTLDVDGARTLLDQRSLDEEGPMDAARSAKAKLLAAPDGHALAYSMNDGKSFRYLGLEQGKEKLLTCLHYQAPDAQAVMARPARLYALDVLKDPARARPEHQADGGPSGAEHNRFTRELMQSIGYAGAHPEDVPLWTELAAAYGGAGPRFELVDADRAVLLATLQTTVRDVPAVRAALLPGLSSAESATRKRTAEALARCHDEETQEALARALLADPFTGDDAACWARAAVTWSLASQGKNRPAATPVVIEALERAAREPDTCPSGRGGKATRIYGVRGLAAVGRSTLLQKLSVPGSEPVPWPEAFSEWNEGLRVADEHSLGAWATEALRHLAHAR